VLPCPIDIHLQDIDDHRSAIFKFAGFGKGGALPGCTGQQTKSDCRNQSQYQGAY
jgi:hypothetical protein